MVVSWEQWLQLPGCAVTQPGLARLHGWGGEAQEVQPGQVEGPALGEEQPAAVQGRR